MTNEVVQVVQSHYWGIGSEWLWAFGQFVVVAITLFFIARQVKIQTASHIVQSVCTIQERWHSDAMQRVRFDVCNRWNKDRKKFDEFDGACEHTANFFGIIPFA